MAGLPPSGWRPTLSDQTPQDVKDAIRIIYQKNDELQSNAAAAIAGVAAQVKTAQAGVQANAEATESILTTIPGYALLQAGSSTQLRQGQGSVLPISSGSFQYDNSVAGRIVWFFTGLVISWPDGTTTPIPDTTLALPSISITGLANSTTYFFYPYYNVGLKTVQWAQVAGGIGTPPAAYTASSVLAGQAQNQDGVVALALGGIQAATSGGGGGGGGGSGGGRRGNGTL